MIPTSQNSHGSEIEYEGDALEYAVSQGERDARRDASETAETEMRHQTGGLCGKRFTGRMIAVMDEERISDGCAAMVDKIRIYLRTWRTVADAGGQATRAWAALPAEDGKAPPRRPTDQCSSKFPRTRA